MGSGSIDSLPLFPREMFIFPLNFWGPRLALPRAESPCLSGYLQGGRAGGTGAGMRCKTLGGVPALAPQPARHLYLCGSTAKPWRGERGGGEASEVLGRASKMLIMLVVLA